MLNFSGVNIWDLKWARPGVLLGIQMQRLNIDDTRALSLIPCNVKDAQCLYQTLTLLMSSAFFFLNPFNLPLLTNATFPSQEGWTSWIWNAVSWWSLLNLPFVEIHSTTDQRSLRSDGEAKRSGQKTPRWSHRVPCRATCPQFGPVGREETRFLPIWPPGIEGPNRSFGFGLTGKDQSSWLPCWGRCLLATTWEFSEKKFKKIDSVILDVFLSRHSGIVFFYQRSVFRCCGPVLFTALFQAGVLSELLTHWKRFWKRRPTGFGWRAFRQLLRVDWKPRLTWERRSWKLQGDFNGKKLKWRFGMLKDFLRLWPGSKGCNNLKIILPHILPVQKASNFSQLPAVLEVSLCRFFPTDLKHVAVSRNAFHSSTSHQCSRSMAPEVLFWGFFICLLVVVSCVDVLACFQSFKIIGFQNPVFYWFYYLQYIFHWVGDFMILERRIHDFWDIPDIPNKIWEQAWCAARCCQVDWHQDSRKDKLRGTKKKRDQWRTGVREGWVKYSLRNWVRYHHQIVCQENCEKCKVWSIFALICGLTFSARQTFYGWSAQNERAGRNPGEKTACLGSSRWIWACSDMIWRKVAII